MGSLVAALASWLDARAHQGKWLIRIEDIDPDRSRDHYSHLILEQLSRCGLESDAEVVFQSQRHHLYEDFIKKLDLNRLLYPCSCSRSQILNALKIKPQDRQTNAPDTPLKGLIYPGTCRDQLSSKSDLEHRGQNESINKNFNNISLRVKTANEVLTWFDRRLGWSSQNIGLEVGDFVVKRSDGPFSYQLCVVADDIDQSITHVVRGEDLADNTPRQILLYQHLSATHPSYLHVPLVKTRDGEKLSKQTFAPALELDSMNDIILTLKSAASHLGLTHIEERSCPLQTHLNHWIHQWSSHYPLHPHEARTLEP
jgi:glutamyl-Q tRNA(Asp) synthetase